MVGQKTCRKACLITLLIATIVGVSLLAGCGVTQQADLWTDPSYKAAPLDKLLVIAIRKDQLKRRMWEDAITTALNNKDHTGTIAVASYQLFPDDIPDTLAVRLRTRDEGFDGVLLVARMQVDTFLTDVPGYTASESVTEYSHRWNAYVVRYEDVYHPGYVETETTASVRTDLLVSQEDGKLVWSVTSQSVDPTSVEQFRNSVADRVASLLKKGRFIH
jgi:hypothetical protein